MNDIVSLVIPTYNERDNIAVLVPEIGQALADYNYEIVIVDDDSRGIFHNAHEFAALYPNSLPVRPTCYCAPRLAFGTEVEAARRRIAQRAGIPYTSPSNTKRPRALVVDNRVPRLGHRP